MLSRKREKQYTNEYKEEDENVKKDLRQDYFDNRPFPPRSPLREEERKYDSPNIKISSSVTGKNPFLPFKNVEPYDFDEDQLSHYNSLVPVNKEYTRPSNKFNIRVNQEAPFIPISSKLKFHEKSQDSDADYGFLEDYFRGGKKTRRRKKNKKTRKSRRKIHRKK